MTLHFARRTTAGLFLTVALSAALATGCDRGVPPLVRAPQSPAALTVYVEPDPTVGEVVDERGHPIVPLLNDALRDALTQAGYQVVAGGTADLTVRLELGRIGYAKYGQGSQPWAEKAKLVVSGGGSPLTEERRPTVNWSDYEGSTTPERIRSAAYRLVNHLSNDLSVVAFAQRPTAVPVGAGPAPGSLAPMPPVQAVPVDPAGAPASGGTMAPPSGSTAPSTVPSAGAAAGATTLGPAVPATAPVAVPTP